VVITGEAARDRVHLLRAQCDAIPGRPSVPCGGRSAAELPPPVMEAARLCGWCWIAPCGSRGLRKLVHSARQTPLWVMTSGLAEAPAAAKLGAAGAQVLHVATPPTARARSDGRCCIRFGEGHFAADGRGGPGWASSFVALTSLTKSGCCAGPKYGADGIPRWTIAGCRPLRVARVQDHVLAKRWDKDTSRSTSALPKFVMPGKARSASFALDVPGLHVLAAD